MRRGLDVFDGREVVDVGVDVVTAGAGACEVLGGTGGVAAGVDGAVVVGVLVTIIVCVAGTGVVGVSVAEAVGVVVVGVGSGRSGLWPIGPNCGGKYGVLFPVSLGLSVKVMPTMVLIIASGSHFDLPFQTLLSTSPVAQIQLNPFWRGTS